MFQCRFALAMIQKFILFMFAVEPKQQVVLALNLNETVNNTQPLTPLVGVSAAVFVCS